MIGGLLAGCIGISKRLMRFPHQRGNGPAVTREIMDTFAAGCALGMLEEPLSKDGGTKGFGNYMGWFLD